MEGSLACSNCGSKSHITIKGNLYCTVCGKKIDEQTDKEGTLDIQNLPSSGNMNLIEDKFAYTDVSIEEEIATNIAATDIPKKTDPDESTQPPKEKDYNLSEISEEINEFISPQMDAPEKETSDTNEPPTEKPPVNNNLSDILSEIEASLADLPIKTKPKKGRPKIELPSELKKNIAVENEVEPVTVRDEKSYENYAQQIIEKNIFDPEPIPMPTANGDFDEKNEETAPKKETDNTEIEGETKKAANEIPNNSTEKEKLIDLIDERLKEKENNIKDDVFENSEGGERIIPFLKEDKQKIETQPQTKEKKLEDEIEKRKVNDNQQHLANWIKTAGQEINPTNSAKAKEITKKAKKKKSSIVIFLLMLFTGALLITAVYAGYKIYQNEMNKAPYYNLDQEVKKAKFEVNLPDFLPEDYEPKYAEITDEKIKITYYFRPNFRDESKNIVFSQEVTQKTTNNIRDELEANLVWKIEEDKEKKIEYIYLNNKIIWVANKYMYTVSGNLKEDNALLNIAKSVN